MSYEVVGKVPKWNTEAAKIVATTITIQQSQPSLATIQQTLSDNYTNKDDETCINDVLEAFFKETYQHRALNEYQEQVDKSMESMGNWLLEVESVSSTAVTRLAEVEEITNTILKSVVHIDNLTDDQKDEVIRQFPAWRPDTDYSAYTVVNYEGTLYEVIQSHTSQDDWRPDEVPALYAKYLNVTITDPETGEETEIINDFVQPTGAHDAYGTGDKVRFNGKVYESNRDGNVWSPADLPSGWHLVED